MDDFYGEMYREYCEGLKVLNVLRNKYIGQLRKAYRDPRVKRTDNIEQIITILNEEISETQENIREIRKHSENRKEEDVLSA